jgi:hypothetical protein
MNIKKIIAGHLLVLALVFPHAVLAEDFTFRVPVNFSNIHEDVNRVLIQCNVMEQATGPQTIGMGNEIRNISGNSNTLNETFTVKFDAATGRNPADAHFYKCFINVGTETNISRFNNGNISPCNLPANDWNCAKQGVTYQGQIQGTIP